MTKFKHLQIKSTATINEALKIIDIGAVRIAIVVDESNKVIGTVTDGDIRRGLLKGLSIDSSIDSIYFKKPTLTNINDSKDLIIQKALSKKIYQIPIVDKRPFKIPCQHKF